MGLLWVAVAAALPEDMDAETTLEVLKDREPSSVL